MKKFILLALTLVLFACSSATKKNSNVNDLRAKLYTDKGIINLYLYPEGAPLTVANFVNLSQRGFYNNLTFHRVVENFVVQGGDPEGTGKGGPGYTFQDEFNITWLNFYDAGMLAMANAGKDTNGSQFFITTKAAAQLNGVHSIFGEIISMDKDMKIVKSIEEGDVIQKIEIIGDTKPLLEKYSKEVSEWNKILDEQK